MFHLVSVKYLKNSYHNPDQVAISYICKVLSPDQYVFKKYFSTSFAISHIYNFVQGFNKGKFVCLIFSDLGKAFDTVTHFLLLSELE